MKNRLQEKPGFHDIMRDPMEQLSVIVQNRDKNAVFHYQNLGGNVVTGVEHHPLITRSVSEISDNSREKGNNHE